MLSFKILPIDMRSLLSFAIVISMSVLVEPQTLPAPQAITDPKQVTSKPNAQVEPSLSIEKLYMTRQIGGSSWSPDGKAIAFISNISGRNNVWTMPAEGGWPVQLTVSDQRQTSPTWSPDGHWIAYMSDYDGDEQWDIFMVNTSTGDVVNLTKTREIAEIAGGIEQLRIPLLRTIQRCHYANQAEDMLSAGAQV